MLWNLLSDLFCLALACRSSLGGVGCPDALMGRPPTKHTCWMSLMKFQYAQIKNTRTDTGWLIQ